MLKFLLILYLFISNEIEAEPVTDSILTEPICDIPLVSDQDKKDFEDFAIKEECLFQTFMDRKQEIVCLIEKNDVENCDEICQEKISEISDSVYEKRVEDDVACVCAKPRNNPTFHTRENDGKISTLKQYIDCWNKLWDTMIHQIETNLTLIQEDYNKDLVDTCKKISAHHEFRCKKFINN